MKMEEPESREGAITWPPLLWVRRPRLLVALFCLQALKWKMLACSDGRNRVIVIAEFAGVLRGNTIRGNTTRNSERKMAL